MVHGIRNPIASIEIDVSFDNVVDCKRELLLSNPNKHKFIGLLMKGLEEGLYAVQRSLILLNIHIYIFGIDIATQRKQPVRSRCCFGE